MTSPPVGVPKGLEPEPVVEPVVEPDRPVGVGPNRCAVESTRLPVLRRRSATDAVPAAVPRAEDGTGGAPAAVPLCVAPEAGVRRLAGSTLRGGATAAGLIDRRSGAGAVSAGGNDADADLPGDPVRRAFVPPGSTRETEAAAGSTRDRAGAISCAGPKDDPCV
jgi:hypothetical protein